jgi:hypothetical protein
MLMKTWLSITLVAVLVGGGAWFATQRTGAGRTSQDIEATVHMDPG